MPNWVPSEEHLDRFKQATNLHMMKRVSAMEAEFPLTLEEVQLVTTPPELARLLALGLDSLYTTNWICFEVGPDVGASRRAIVQVHLERPQHYAYSRQTRTDFAESKPIYFNNELDPNSHARLIQWVDRSVYERRLAQLVSIVVADFLKHTPKISLYQIAARWPALRVMFPRIKPAYGTYGGYRHADIWERHGKELGRNLRRWGWPVTGPEAEWRYGNQRKMQVVEDAILSVMSLPETPARQSQFWAAISDWEKLSGQIV